MNVNMEDDFDIRDARMPENEREYENVLRPLSLRDFSGQAKVGENLKGFVRAARMRKEALEQVLTEPVPAEEVLNRAKELAVSERTLMIAKKNLGVVSEKRGSQWYWRLPEQGWKDVTT